MPEINGGCRCGKVRYTTTADPVFTGVCHCITCRKSTGSAFATVLAVPTGALTVTGITTQFDDIGDSGKPTHRQFCSACGSTVTQSAEIMPGVTMVGVGTLDDPDWIKPAMQIYCDSALAWAKVPDMREFAKMPA